MWFLPIALIVFTLIIAIPLSKYIAWIMEGKYRAWAFFRWFEARLDAGPMN
jgi:K+-transporting ATPase ATPase A chain